MVFILPPNWARRYVRLCLYCIPPVLILGELGIAGMTYRGIAWQGGSTCGRSWAYRACAQATTTLESTCKFATSVRKNVESVCEIVASVSKIVGSTRKIVGENECSPALYQLNMR